MKGKMVITLNTSLFPLPLNIPSAALIPKIFNLIFVYYFHKFLFWCLRTSQVLSSLGVAIGNF